MKDGKREGKNGRDVVEKNTQTEEEKRDKIIK